MAALHYLAEFEDNGVGFVPSLCFLLDELRDEEKSLFGEIKSEFLKPKQKQQDPHGNSSKPTSPVPPAVETKSTAEKPTASPLPALCPTPPSEALTSAHHKERAVPESSERSEPQPRATSPSYLPQRVGGLPPSRPGSAPLHPKMGASNRSPGTTSVALQSPTDSSSSYVDRWMKNLYARQQALSGSTQRGVRSNSSIPRTREGEDKVLSDRTNVAHLASSQKGATPDLTMTRQSTAPSFAGHPPLPSSGAYRAPRSGSASRFGRSDSNNVPIGGGALLKSTGDGPSSTNGSFSMNPLGGSMDSVKALPTTTGYVLPGRRPRHVQALVDARTK